MIFMRTWFLSLWEIVVKILTGIGYSLPVQLLINHLRHHKSLVIFWVILILLVTQNITKSMGGPYLFLEPEYLNEFSPAAMFILGVSFGIFSLAFQLTSYILDGTRFYFLGEEEQAFLKFSLNNSLLPMIFWVIYLVSFFQFQSSNPEMTTGRMIGYASATVAGGISVSLIFGGYFWQTNTDLGRLLRQTVAKRLIPKQEEEAKRLLYTTIRVDYFLAALWKIKTVPKKVLVDKLTLLRILNQNHSNALFAEFVILVLLIVLGIFQEIPFVRIPAGASFMILFSFVIMLMGAVDYWFRRVGVITFALFMLSLVVLNRWELFVGKNYAFGLNYKKEPVTYELNTLKKIATPANYKKDYLTTLQILQNWKKRWHDKYGYNRLPKMVFLCTSGGGHRSAVWTMRALQHADQQMNGQLKDQIVLMCGASGGMLGASYFREQMYQQTMNPKINLYDPQYLDNISRDLLNPVIFNLTTNTLFPSLRFKDSTFWYEKDRGYYFDEQLTENIDVFADRRLRDYAEPERKAIIPMMILSPSIVNDGRQLLISPQKMSFLMKSETFNDSYKNEISAVDYAHLFAEHQPGRLHFATALRMNATFPTLLPYVELPTEPRIQVADAGMIDNFGINVSLRFMHVFKDWIRANTAGVVILQFRDTQREAPILPDEPRTVMGKLGDTFGGTYLAFAEGKDFFNDQLLEYAKDWFPNRFNVVDLQYLPKKTFEEAALSFHLTQREKQDVLNSIHHPDNQKAFKILKELLR